MEMEMNKCNADGKLNPRGEYILYKLMNKSENLVLFALGGVKPFRQSRTYTYFLTNGHKMPSTYNEAVQNISRYHVG